MDWLQCNIECQEGCPVNTNCRGYLMLAAEGRFEEGYILARDPNPVAAICGYVCSAPCEKACRRADIDKPLAIRAMKRFLVDWHYGNNMPDNVIVQPATGLSVAVIGAGPAGLSAAKELAAWGHEVHVYEALPSGGGHDPHRRSGLPAAARRHRARRQLGREARRAVPLQRRDRPRRHARPAQGAARSRPRRHRLHVPGRHERPGRGARRRDLRRRLPQARQPRAAAVGRGARGRHRRRLHRHGLVAHRPPPGRQDLDHPLPPRAGRDGRGRGGAARDSLRGRAVRVLRQPGRSRRRPRRPRHRHDLPAHPARPTGRDRPTDRGADPGQRVHGAVRHGHPVHQPGARQQRARRVRRAAEPPRRRDRYARDRARAARSPPGARSR